jgi:hypothetical protein
MLTASRLSPLDSNSQRPWQTLLTISDAVARLGRQNHRLAAACYDITDVVNSAGQVARYRATSERPPPTR